MFVDDLGTCGCLVGFGVDQGCVRCLEAEVGTVDS